MNALSFVALARLGAKPLEPFGKGSNALKAGTPDAGPEGPTVPGALNAGTAVRSAPGRGRAEYGLIRAAGEEWQGYRDKAIGGQREGLVGPWSSSASRTASSTPSRICLSPGPLAAGALRSFFMPASRASMFWLKSFWRNAGSVRARAS